jgi:hypothetical protein
MGCTGLTRLSVYSIYRSAKNEWERVWKEMGLTQFDVQMPHVPDVTEEKLAETAAITSGLPEHGRRLRTLPARNRTPVPGL